MDLFDMKIFDQYDRCSDAFYVADDVKHKESLYCDLIKGDKSKRHFFIKNGAITSGWMELFGYGDVLWGEKGDNESPVFCLEIISKIISPLGIGGSYFEKISKDEFIKNAKESLGIFRDAIEKTPVLGSFYPMYFNVIKETLAYYDGEIVSDEEIMQIGTHIRVMTTVFRFSCVGYYEAKKYIEDVFLKPQEYGITMPPDKIVENYKNYNRLYQTKGDDLYASNDFYSLSTSEKTPNAGFHGKAKEDPGWEAFIKDRQEKDVEGVALLTVNQLSHIAISQLIHDNRTIRKCKLCGRYFKVRYNSSQEYCTRKYKDTKYPCNEYVSRQAAKDRFFEHPVHAEYNTAYNRLYGRIRRGKVPKDTPLNAKLKELHDKYFEKYEAAPPEKQEAILNEYKEKNKKLFK
jgi:hypothetical protein